MISQKKHQRDHVNDDDQHIASSEQTARRAGILLFTGVAIFYLALMPGFAVPGRWAEIASVFGGLDPFQPLMRPLWSLLSALIAEWPVRQLGLLFNAVSALIGATACWFIYDTVRRVPFERTLKSGRQTRSEQRSRLIAGVAASLFAALSLPVIMVSTRGDYAILDLLLALLAVHPFFCFSGQLPRAALFYRSAAAAGLAMAEYPGMVFVAPLLAVMWLVKLHRGRLFRLKILLTGAASFIAGCSIILIYGFVMAGSEPALMRGMAGSGDVLREFALMYYNELRHSVPKIGWLLLIATNILPFAVVMFNEMHEPDDKFSALGVYLLRLIIITIGVVTLLELPGSPSRLIDSRVLLVTPYILAAVWLGYLAGYHDFLINHNRPSQLKKFAFPSLIAALAMGALLRNSIASRPAELTETVHLAREVVARMETRTHLVTAGVLDQSLRLAAHEASRPLAIINLNHGTDIPRGRYYASLFTEPALQDMARLGVMPLIRDWFNRDPGIAGKLALMVPPEMLVPAAYQAVPDRVVYRLMAAAAGETDALTLFKEHQAYWSALSLTPYERLDDGPVKYQRVWISRIANDLGVYLQEHGQFTEADAAYEEAVALWPDNFSATINQLARARALNDPDNERIITDRLNVMTERNRAMLATRSFGQLSGRLYGPAALLEEAQAMKMSGQPGLAASRIQRAAGLINESDTGLQLSLARLYLQNKDLNASAEAFERILAQRPDDIDAQLGLLRVAIQRRQFDEAEKRLVALESLGHNPDRIAFERVGWLMAQERTAEAKTILSDLTSRPTPLLEAWYQLGLLGLTSGDEELFASAAAVLTRHRGFMPGMLLLGEHASRASDPVAARMYLEQARMLDPANTRVLERLLMIDYFDRNVAALRDRSANLLGIDPDNTVGLFGAATVHIASERYDLAEGPLRRCLERADYGPAHNELAWILSERGSLDEALHHARRAVELMPDNGNALDTLAVVYQKQGDHQAAAQTIERAIKINDGASISILINAATIFIDAARLEDARNTLDRLERARSAMSPEQQQTLDTLQARLASPAS